MGPLIYACNACSRDELLAIVLSTQCCRWRHRREWRFGMTTPMGEGLAGLNPAVYRARGATTAPDSLNDIAVVRPENMRSARCC